MKITAKVGYASLAIVRLALQPQSERLQAREIAEAQGIPLKFLEQILIQLKNAGLVRSIRGAGGGYLLGRPADQITLRDLLEAVEGEFRLIDVEIGDATVREIWQAVEEDVVKRLEAVTVQMMVDQKLQKNQILNYEI
jgi:Rrf2 family protein